MMTFFTSNKKNNLRLSLSLSFLFLLSACVACAVYLTIEVENCKKTINRVPDYIPEKTCYCKNNVASNGLWLAIISNTSFYKQFDVFPNMNPYAGITQTFTLRTDTGDVIVLHSKSLASFYNYYLNYYFSNRLNNITFDIFDFEEFLGVAPLPPKQTVPSLYNTTCGFSYNATYREFYADKDECRKIIHSYRSDFVSSMTFSYDNEMLRRYCDLDYCEVQFCPFPSMISMGLFCITITAVIFTVFRIIYYFGVHVIDAREKKKLNLQKDIISIQHLSHEKARESYESSQVSSEPPFAF